ncbi:uncharacterized protein METZ01_LOCUS356681, partial [marine metagenome]
PPIASIELTKQTSRRTPPEQDIGGYNVKT